MEPASFLPPLFGSLVGVYIAFGLNTLWSIMNDEITSEKFFKDIMEELETCLEKLEKKGHLLPVNMWKLGVSSGMSKMIPYRIKHELASCYSDIENYNYEAVKAREVAIYKEIPSNEAARKRLEDLHSIYSGEVLRREEGLKIKIKTLLKIDYAESVYRFQSRFTWKVFIGGLFFLSALTLEASALAVGIDITYLPLTVIALIFVISGGYLLWSARRSLKSSLRLTPKPPLFV